MQPPFGSVQTAGSTKPPFGTVTKSWQTHIFWQQNGPAVTGHMQTNPLVHLVPGSVSEQSSSVLQLAVHIAPSSAALATGPLGVGSMQMRLGHCKLGDEMIVVLVPASAPTFVTQARPMC